MQGSVKPIVIANNGTASEVIDQTHETLSSIYVPTITAATIQVKGSMDGTNFKDIKDTTGAVVGLWASSTGDFICDADTIARLVGIPFLQIVSGGAQGAARTFLVRLVR